MRLQSAANQTGNRARINGAEITVDRSESLLEAALRQGIDFPNSCRVGGCGTCKCKLQGGRVRELTDSSYVLSAEDLADGMVLACQTRLQSDVDVTVEMPARIAGVVMHQERVTHDITRLVIQPSQAIDFKAGQYITLSLDSVTRCYSIANAPKAGGPLEFYIRYAPGGQFTTKVHQQSLVGTTLTLGRPDGDFILRDSMKPLLLVAGGSGLAPLLSILRHQIALGKTRQPVTLLFGARAQRDLYALSELEAIASQWDADFLFLPSLSEPELDRHWEGHTGLVTEHISQHLTPDTDAYLCGPPAMVDAGCAKLRALGIDSRHIHFDRFTTAAPDEQAPVDAAAAGLWDYMKFGLFHVIGLISALALLGGSQTIVMGTLFIVGAYLFGDALGGDDTKTPHYEYPGVLTFLLWLALPMLTFICFASIWTVSPVDLFGFGAAVVDWTGIDILATKSQITLGQHATAIILTGLMIGMVGTIPAHELTHRTWDFISLSVGRCLLAFSFDTVFSIEHVYGHHRYVSTRHDPATAPRGRNVYLHILLSTLTGNISAWQIEAARLAKMKKSPLSFSNRVISGHLMSAALVLLVAVLAGATTAGYFVLCALWGKALLEIVNYMEHYGLVRDPDDTVKPYHSWNTNRRMSSWTMFNLTRHSHHHAKGEVPYHRLRPYEEAPMMLGGYLTTIIVALVPPLWHRLMIPKVLDWDRRYASPRERVLAAEANARSGIPAFMQATTNVALPQPSSNRVQMNASSSF